MTTARRQRCAHCQSTYIYHPSFYGGDEVNYPHNDHSYCPDCYKVVREALSKVPVKYEKKWLPSDAYTKEQIVEHQEKRLADPPLSSPGHITIPGMRRVMVGYIDMTGKTQHHNVCELMPDGEWYLASWWSHEPEKVEVSKETWCKV